MTNGVTIKTNYVCHIKGFCQTVWFHPEYITNVLSLSLLKNKYRITYDSKKGGSFVVHRPGKKIFTSNLISVVYILGNYLIRFLNVSRW